MESFKQRLANPSLMKPQDWEMLGQAMERYEEKLEDANMTDDTKQQDEVRPDGTVAAVAANDRARYNQRQRRYYAKNPDMRLKRRAEARQWRRDNSEKVAIYRRDY